MVGVTTVPWWVLGAVMLLALLGLLKAFEVARALLRYLPNLGKDKKNKKATKGKDVQTDAGVASSLTDRTYHYSEFGERLHEDRGCTALANSRNVKSRKLCKHCSV